MENEGTIKTILVIGGYGHAGTKIVKGLLEKTAFNVLAVGKRPEKLESLVRENNSNRLSVEILDAGNTDKLTLYCQKADMVINASGPFSLGGDEIVKTVVQCKKPYIDIANEQLHLMNLRQLKPEIEESGSMVFTCTGQSPGVSTLVIIHLAEMLREVNSIKIYGVAGRMPSPDQALASIMSGIIESSLCSTTYIDGKQVYEPLGKFIKKQTFPEPIGEKKLMSVPLNDSILIPEKIKCNSVRTLFAIDKEFSPILFSIMRWLKPHKRKWAYKMLEKIVKKNLKCSYEEGLTKGFFPGGYIKVIMTGSKDIEALIAVEDNSVMVSYMPIVIAINYFDNPENFKGLLTPADKYTFDTFNNELDKLGWKIHLEVNRNSKQ